MIKIVLFVASLSVVSATYRRGIGSPAYYGYAPGPTEYRPKTPANIYATYTDSKPVYADSYGENYKPQPYNFGYNVDDGYGNSNFRNEEGDDYGNKKGSYGYTDSYGIYRKVDYVADEHGFRATISSNEPGVANANPADVKIYHQEPPAASYGSSGSYGSGGSAPYKASSYGVPIYSPPVLKPYSSYAVPSYRPYRPSSSYKPSKY